MRCVSGDDSGNMVVGWLACLCVVKEDGGCVEVSEIAAHWHFLSSSYVPPLESYVAWLFRRKLMVPGREVACCSWHRTTETRVVLSLSLPLPLPLLLLLLLDVSSCQYDASAFSKISKVEARHMLVIAPSTISDRHTGNATSAFSRYAGTIDIYCSVISRPLTVDHGEALPNSTFP